jgi:hypothetical protein
MNALRKIDPWVSLARYVSHAQGTEKSAKLKLTYAAKSAIVAVQGDDRRQIATLRHGGIRHTRQKTDGTGADRQAVIIFRSGALPNGTGARRGARDHQSTVTGTVFFGVYSVRPKYTSTSFSLPSANLRSSVLRNLSPLRVSQS